MDPQFTHRHEIEWVGEDIVEEDDGVEQKPPTIFNVPKALIFIKEEAYIPQVVSIGPYHHGRPELYEMEQQKVSLAKNIQRQLIYGHTFEDIAVRFTNLEPKIRACYDKYLDLDGETLALLSTIDAAFLLEFLLSYVQNADAMLTRSSSQMLHLVDSKRRTSAGRGILRDIIMLENQIPLFLVIGLLDFYKPEHSNQVLVDMFLGLYKDLSPIKKIAKFPGNKKEFLESAHLLEFLYCLLVPRTLRGEGPEIVEIEVAGDPKPIKTPLIEQIIIPSVTILSGIGIKFHPAEGGLETIRFHKASATFYLPIIDLDDTSQVVLRNLLAYEESVAPDATVFVGYIQLMARLINNEEDVKLLREAGVILNHLESDDEAASLWNGMGTSVTTAKVPELDKIIEEINGHYSSKWSVKSKGFAKKCVIGSWPLLVFITANLLLLMTAVQTICSIFDCCPSWLST